MKENKVNFVSVLVNPADEILENEILIDYYQLYDVGQKNLEIKDRYKIKLFQYLLFYQKKKYKDYLEISDIILFDPKGHHNQVLIIVFRDVPRGLDKMIGGNIQINDIPSLKIKIS